MDETVVISLEKTIGFTPILEAWFGANLLEGCSECDHGVLAHVGDVGKLTGESAHPELIGLACIACAMEKGQLQSICYLAPARWREAIGWRGDS